ncbi:MAG: amidase [Pseudomonadota bacterium]
MSDTKTQFAPAPTWTRLEDLVKGFRDQSRSPAETLKAFLDRIESVNPVLNAFLHLDEEEAYKAAQGSEARWAKNAPLSPIDGVPFGVKANIAMQGAPWHAGIGAYTEQVALEDATVVERLRQAGAIPLGILNMHEGALGATTDNPFFGTCKNPWDTDRTPGGSSGGSGAAVAAGLCAFALGTDTMGSVRIPSAYCGVSGHKPSFGVLPSNGLIDLSPTLDHIGIHASTPSGCALVMDVLAGVHKNTENLRNIRVGITDWGDAVSCEADILEAFEGASGILENFVSVSHVDLSDVPFGMLRRRGLLVSEVEGYHVHRKAIDAGADGFSEDFTEMLRYGAAQSQEKIDAAYASIKGFGHQFLKLFEAVDVLAMPTAPQRAFRFDEETPANQADFTALANFAGAPATATPMTASKNDAPPSIQFIGKPGADGLTLAVANAYFKTVN